MSTLTIVFDGGVRLDHKVYVELILFPPIPNDVGVGTLELLSRYHKDWSYPPEKESKKIKVALTIEVLFKRKRKPIAMISMDSNFFVLFNKNTINIINNKIWNNCQGCQMLIDYSK